MSPSTFLQSPHGLACDGCGIAKDDLQAIEHMEKRDEVVRELFHNAARIRKAMASNHLLHPIFRKYRKACREILQQKKDESEQFARLCDYCDNPAHDPHQQRHDLKCIQTEMREIYDQIQIKSLEDLQWTDDDSDSATDPDPDTDTDTDEDEESHDASGVSSSSSSSVSDDSVVSDDSDDSDDSALSDVMEFLRLSQIE
jgi:hypothetical protein